MKRLENKKKRILLAIILILIIGFSGLMVFGKITGFAIGGFNSNIQTCKGCNVILVSIDTLRADHLPCYGYDKNTAPNICAFAKDSILFENAYSSAPWTFSAHFAMMTGKYPKKTSELLISQNISVDDSYDVLAEKLQREGYKTAAFTGGGYVSGKLGFSQGFESYSDSGGFVRNKNDIIQWIQTNQDKKFFLFLHDFQVHSPYDPPEDIKYQFFEGEVPSACANKYLVSKKEPETADDLPNATISRGKNSCLDAEGGLEYTISQYDGDIYEADRKLAEILDGIKEAGLLDKTIIIITADHGEGFGEHGLFFHTNSLYNELIHVPLIMRIPGSNSGRINTNVETASIMPSTLDILGLNQPSDTDGLSFVSVIKGAKYEKMILAFMSKKVSEIDQNNIKEILTVAPNNKSGKKEVYDISEDPGEKENLIGEYEDVKSFDSLGILYNSIEEGHGKVLADPEVLEQLKALGYVN